jgi:hypothetical protein
LLDELGRESESRPLHMKLITAMSSKEDASPFDLRGAALAALLIGEYQVADTLLQRLLTLDFEVCQHILPSRVRNDANRSGADRKR